MALNTRLQALATAIAAEIKARVPNGGTNGQVLTKVGGVNAWANGVSTATAGLDLNVNNTAPSSPTLYDLWVDADESSDTATRLAATNNATFLNYNSVVQSGWYVMDSTQANAPASATMYLEVRAYSTTYIEQVARHVVTGAKYTRYMTAGTWGAWIPDVADVNPTYFTGIVSAGEGNVIYKRGNTVHLALYIQNNKAGTVSSLFTVPAGFRPPRMWRFLATRSDATHVRVNVAADGTVSMEGVALPASNVLYGSTSWVVA